jgi:hypothetical protein
MNEPLGRIPLNSADHERDSVNALATNQPAMFLSLDLLIRKLKAIETRRTLATVGDDP